MLDPISTALPGLSAAAKRNDAPASPLQNKESAGALPTAGAPIAESAYRAPEALPQSASTPDGVDGAEASGRNSGFDSTYASLRSSTPAYLVVYDARDTAPNEQGSIVDEAAPDASAERAEKSRQAETASTQQNGGDSNAQVTRRYDIGAS